MTVRLAARLAALSPHSFMVLTIYREPLAALAPRGQPRLRRKAFQHSHTFRLMLGEQEDRLQGPLSGLQQQQAELVDLLESADLEAVQESSAIAFIREQVLLAVGEMAAAAGALRTFKWRSEAILQLEPPATEGREASGTLQAAAVGGRAFSQMATTTPRAQ